MSDKPGFKVQDDARGAALSDYWPLAALILVSAAAAGAVTWHLQSAVMDWMHYFMGFFLCSFGMLKVFHPSSFADGFEMYDIIGKRSRIYAVSYPFIELALGLGYLSFVAPPFVYGATVVVMTIGAIGVVNALREGLDIYCPCMGSVLDVPLSTVTLTEDIGMGLMAAAMLVMTLI